MAGGIDDDDPPVSERHARARKVKRQLSQGPLVKAAFAQNLAEAEFIQALLLEEGVPSVLRRTRGFDVPDFLAAGPRDVMVPQSGLQTAREVLLQAPDLAPTVPGGAAGLGDHARVDPVKVAIGIAVALVVLFLLVVLAG